MKRSTFVLMALLVLGMQVRAARMPMLEQVRLCSHLIVTFFYEAMVFLQKSLAIKYNADYLEFT